LRLLPDLLFSLLAWSPDAPTLLRLAAAAGVFPLLYAALGEEDEGWSRGVLRRLLFGLLGCAVFFMLTANWVPREDRAAQGRGFQSYATGVLAHRFSHTALPLDLPEQDGLAPRDAALRNLRKAVEGIPESAFFRRYYGIVLAESGKHAQALRTLEKAMDLLARRAPERAAEERTVWRGLYGPEPATRDAIRAAQGRLEAYGLGWIGRVGILAAYERLGSKAAPRELRWRVAEEARRDVRRLVSGSVIFFLSVIQLGLISLVVGIILIRASVLRPVRPSWHPVSAVLWESFILMMALGIIVPVLASGGRRPAAETQPVQYALLLLVSDAGQLLALLYLWLRLRGRSLALGEIGLSGRHFWANVLIGVMAMTVLTPTAMVIGLVTEFISSRFFPNIAAPYHPLGGLTAGSTSIEIRLALFTAAAIGAPLLEETFFRGALYGAIRRRHGLWAGVLGSAGFFAILHPQLPLGFLPIAALGAAFAGLYEWRKSLIPGIVAHALHNGCIVLLQNLVFPAAG
jgi:membrane protease YdiL (CAAX protease family)